MENSSNIHEIIEKLIDKNTLETLETIEDEYWKHIEYTENRNTLIYSGRTISVLVVIVIAIILLINKIKKKKYNKILLTFLIIFIIITIATFFIPIWPV